MEILCAIFILIICYVLWQKWELAQFQVTEYQVPSPKLKAPAKAAVVADLHGFTYGKNNQRLLRQVRALSPQAILIPGDMLVSKYPQTYGSALSTLQELAKIAPVYYSYGNHESRLKDPEAITYPLFLKYLEDAKALGVTILETESLEIPLGENQVMLSALELDLKYYEKGKFTPLEPGYMNQRLPMENPHLFQILLAHNPAYASAYAAWGADVAFCGHNHGGLIRIPGIGSLISPQFTWFPKYDAGMFQLGNTAIVVSRGLGTHTFHIRIFNRAELLSVKFVPGEK